MPGYHKWLTRYSVPSRQKKKTTNDRNRMASELCKACEEGRNCINGRYCPPRRQYVEHQNIKECNGKKKKEQSLNHRK